MGWFGDAVRTVVAIVAIIPGAWQIAARVALLVDGAAQARRARASARAASAAAEYAERQQSTRSASDVGRIIYGKDIVAGSLRYWQTTGEKGEFLHLVYILAAHECDAVETVYFNDKPLPSADANGFIQSGDFFEGKTEHQRGTRVGAGSITLANTITGIVAVTRLTPGAGNSELIFSGYSYAGNVVTITDSTAGATFWVDCTYAVGTPRVKIRPFLGADNQTAIADLVADSGGKWTANHRLRGLCGVYVRIEYTPEMFGQIGIPEVKCLVRGHKVADPRTGTTVWTDNSALCMAHYLKTYCAATSAEVPDATTSAEANACDQTVTINVGGTTQKRYTCNVALSTDMTPRDILAIIGETMASGASAYAGGQFLIRAGVARTPTLTITNDIVVGAVTIQAATRRTSLHNRVVVSYAEATKLGVITEASPVTNATYLSADGGMDLPLYLTVEGCNESFRAQRLGKIALERIRQGLRADMQCTLDAYDALPGDWVSVTLDRYGWSAKTFEVLSRRIDLETGLISYSMQEIAAGVYDWNYGLATTVDLTPNTSLPNPLTPPAALVMAEPVTGTAALQRLSDGTIISRALIAWTQSADVFVVRGGTVEIEWLYSGDTAWNRGESVPGDAVQQYIGPLTDGKSCLVRIRAVNTSGRIGSWSYKAFVVVGKTAPPANVAGLAASVRGGQARITWASNAEADYAETEIRIGANWAAGVTLFRGDAQSAPWSPYPAEGSYTIWATHYDSTGNASTPQSIAVAVSSVGSIFVGGNVLPNADFTGYTGASTLPDGWVPYVNGLAASPAWSRQATGSIDNGAWVYVSASTLYGSSVDRVGIATNGNQPLPMPSGGPVVISGHAIHAATSNCVFFGEYKNSVGTVLGTFTKYLPAGASTWKRYEFFDNAPVNTAYLFFYVWFEGLGTSSTLNAGIDKLSVSPGDSSLPFAPKAGEIYPGQVGTNELFAGAATEIWFDEYDFAGTSVGNVLTTARSFPVTPAYDCTLEISCEIASLNVNADSGNILFWRVDGSDGTSVSIGGVPRTVVDKMTCTILSSLPATGGVTYTLKTMVRAGGGGVIYLYQSRQRVTEVRR
jgi:hypothetical protein